MTAGGSPAANISTPSSGHQDTGWLNSEKPASAEANWWLRWASAWFKWLDAVWPEEHDDDGHHTDVYVSSTLDVESTRSIRYVLGLNTQDARLVHFDCGNPAIAPWVVQSGTPVYNPGATPPNTSVAPGGTLVVTRGLPELVVGQDDSSAGDQWVGLDLGATGKRKNAADALVVKLYEVAKTGLAAGAAVATHTKATNAAYQNTNTSINVSIDPSKWYWLEATVTVDAGSAAGDAGLSNAFIGANRLHLE